MSSVVAPGVLPVRVGEGQEGPRERRRACQSVGGGVQVLKDALRGYPTVGLRLAKQTGVLYRAMGISSLDFGKEESYVLLDRLLEEAEMQRGGSSDAV